MESVLFNASELISTPGGAEMLKGKLEDCTFNLSGMDYAVEGGIEYSLTLSNIGDAIVVTGTAKALVVGECTRCLERAELYVDSDVDGYYTISEDSNVDGLEEDEYELIGEDNVIDLSEAIFSAIFVEIDPVFLCSDDCKGLCPKCGCNLNVEQCTCSEKPDEFNPFYILTQLKFDDDDKEQES